MWACPARFRRGRSAGRSSAQYAKTGALTRTLHHGGGPAEAARQARQDGAGNPDHRQQPAVANLQHKARLGMALVQGAVLSRQTGEAGGVPGGAQHAALPRRLQLLEYRAQPVEALKGGLPHPSALAWRQCPRKLATWARSRSRTGQQSQCLGPHMGTLEGGQLGMEVADDAAAHHAVAGINHVAQEVHSPAHRHGLAVPPGGGGPLGRRRPRRGSPAAGAG